MFRWSEVYDSIKFHIWNGMPMNIEKIGMAVWN